MKLTRVQVAQIATALRRARDLPPDLAYAVQAELSNHPASQTFTLLADTDHRTADHEKWRGLRMGDPCPRCSRSLCGGGSATNRTIYCDHCIVTRQETA